eukprot:TRINITY_DN1478_c0_g1_i1.p2 TRINITY_DN1478_c0_g1~~TRINITY_DN1478_c0_g1_i1.p2  ORF type:complete len:152 (-),score=12.22 TRINITY_DN1478_c0_g1_i1:218-673(-)
MDNFEIEATKWKRIIENRKSSFPKLCCRICETEVSADLMVSHTELCLEKSVRRDEFKQIDDYLLDLGEELTKKMIKKKQNNVTVSSKTSAFLPKSVFKKNLEYQNLRQQFAKNPLLSRSQNGQIEKNKRMFREIEESPFYYQNANQATSKN